jgi:protein-disulfide isomerase
VAFLFFLPALSVQGAGGDDAAMSEGQAQAILEELQAIRQVLQRIEQQGREPTPPPRRAGPPTNAKVSVRDRPTLGEPDAPVTLVEFVDYECPFCRKFFMTTYQQLKEEYIDPGRVRLVAKDFPLRFHKFARKAGQAAHCAGEQGKYWPMHDLLFGGALGLNEGALVAYAQQLQLDLEKFRGCLASDRHLREMRADVAEAEGAGINGTPGFVIGRERDGVVEGAHIRGALPLRVFKGHIDRLLGQADNSQ